MAIDAIGGALASSASSTTNTTLNQSDFIKLFLTELSFQDPLQPVDNREFLAQMAQFSNLEQTRVSNENTSNLVSMDATTQSLSLLGRRVSVSNSTGASSVGTVTAITFSSSGPQLTVTDSSGNAAPGVMLSQITLVQQ